MGTPHIESEREDIAKIVLMPGDPKRSEFIANNFLVGARLVNTLRGATAYTGYYKNTRITVFPSGMGMPSMGIYSHELFNDYDVDVIVRVGTAGAYRENLKLYDVFLADSAYSNTSFDEESISKSVDVINSSFELNSTIREKAQMLGIDLKVGRIHTSEAFYTIDDKPVRMAMENGCEAVEMETFALLINAKKYHKRATALLTITDEIYSGEKMTGKDREIKLNSMITLALESVIKIKN